MAGGAKWVGLHISESADLLGISTARDFQILGVWNRQNGDIQFCGWKCLADDRLEEN